MSRIGCDIGSTNTCLAVHDGRLRMIEFNEGGAVSMPTVITIAEGEVYIGFEGVEVGRRYPDFEFRNFKRRLAEKWHPDEDTGYQTCEGTTDGQPNGMLHYRGPEGADYSPTELYSYQLGEAIRAANAFLAPHDEVTGITLCVPAKFEPEQIEAARKAAAMAGVEDVTIIEEPIAAAIFHGIDVRKKPKRHVVCDLGGGTLDVSILSAGDGRMRVIGKNGNAHLGGVDWDRRVADYMINLYRTEHGTDLTVRDAAMVRIMNEAETVKKRLTDKEETEFRVEDIDRTPDGISQHMIYPIDRRTFDELTADLRERIFRACQLAIADVRKDDPNFSIRDIHELILVGGMTRVPSVRAAISEFFDRAPKKDGSPESVVAMGAAIKGAILDGRLPDITIADITSHDIAIESRNNIPAIVVQRGTPYPIVDKPINIRNADDDQTEISLRLLYATRPKAEDCTVLQSEDIVIEPGPKETVKLQMLLSVDKDGTPSMRRAAA